MRKNVLLGLVVLALLGSLVAVQALVEQVDEQPTLTTELPESTQTMASSFGPPLPRCGDYCDAPGASRGCIDDSGYSFKRVICTCTAKQGSLPFWSCW